MARSFRTAAPGSGMHTASLLLLASSIQPRHFAHGLPCACWALPSREFVVDDHGGRFPAMTWDVVRGRTLMFHGALLGSGSSPFRLIGVGNGLQGWAHSARLDCITVHTARRGPWNGEDFSGGALTCPWVHADMLAGSFSCAAGACCSSGVPNVSARSRACHCACALWRRLRGIELRVVPQQNLVSA